MEIWTHVLQTDIAHTNRRVCMCVLCPSVRVGVLPLPTIHGLVVDLVHQKKKEKDFPFVCLFLAQPCRLIRFIIKRQYADPLLVDMEGSCLHFFLLFI